MHWLLYAVPATVARVLTHGYRRFDGGGTGAGATGIVLLGAGEDHIVGWSDRSAVITATEGERVLEAVRVYRILAPAWIISSGGGSSFDRAAEPSSVWMRDWLVRFGVPASRVLLESGSHDTHDEALAILPIVRSRGIARVVVVTSTVHMPRAMGTFRAVGLDVTAAIAPNTVDFRGGREFFMPSGRGLEFSAQVIHELIGLPYYWARGWYR